MLITQTIEETRRARQELTGRVALVPTMGALHDGHMALVEAAAHHAQHVVVSIFVNPTQFGANEDFDRYPRTLEADLARCREAGVALVFAPTVADMYPPSAIPSDLSVPSLATILEGAHRPGHFNGVCRVVAKLFNIIQPDIAIFGRKDYQQWRVIEAFVADLNMPVTIIAHPTVREADGLAMSSRNVYLKPEERPHALGLYKALTEAKLLIEEAGETDPAVVERAMQQMLTSHHVAVDYAVIRHPHTLAPLDAISPELTDGVVALVAGRVGNVRLIDNMVIGER